MKNLSLIAFLVLLTHLAFGQRTIEGTVVDEGGEPLIGASVIAKGTTVGTTTDIDGAFALKVPEGTTTLQVSYVGFPDTDVDVSDASLSKVAVVIKEGEILDEVLVVGYGEKNKRFNVQTVSQIGSEAVKNIPSVSPQQILQGQIAGVQMTNSSGVLGAASSVKVRGVASISAGGSPLYVIDGVPLNDDANSSDYGGTALNPLLDIDPNDIETISVLKDASAAIYGARGSNGVILITTKKGKAGKNNINLNLSTGWLTETRTFDMVDSEGYNEIDEVFLGADPATQSDEYFDWKNAVLQTGKTNEAALNFTGGTEKTRYFLGGSYLKQSNYSIGNDLSKLSGRMNFSHELMDRIRIGANIGVANTKMDRTSTENSTFAPLTSAYLQDPHVSAYNDDGTFANTGFIANVIAIEELGLVDLTSRRNYGNVFAEMDIIDGLTLRTSWGLDDGQLTEEFREVDVFTPGGYAYKSVINTVKWLNTNTINYRKYINDDNYINVKLGQGFETFTYTDTEVEGTGFAADQLPNVGSAATLLTASATRNENSIASVFGTAEYRYKDRYLVEFLVRRDGSSKFGANNKWGTFWSASAGWIISEEAFMADQNLFSLLKLRVSYGTTGNDRIGNYAALGLYGGGTDSDYSGEPGLRPTSAANPNLKWESTSHLNIGFESSFLKDRVRLNMDYYIKNTTDMLLGFPLPASSGFTSITRNAGKMKNYGVDLELGVTALRGDNYSWDIDFNMGYLKNKITDLADATEDADGNQFITGSSSQRAVLGMSANEFYLIRYKGINPDSGDPEWLDKDGNVTNEPTANDRVFVGSALPKFTGGLTNTIKIYDFDLSFFFNYALGHKVYVGELRFTENPYNGFNRSADLLDYWKAKGDNAFAPDPESPFAGNFAQRSTQQLFNGSYARLKNLALGYNLKGKKLGTSAFENIRIYVQANNLFSIQSKDFRGQDIEISDSGQSNLVQGESFFVLPQAKIFKIGLNATF